MKTALGENVGKTFFGVFILTSKPFNWYRNTYSCGTSRLMSDSYFVIGMYNVNKRNKFPIKNYDQIYFNWIKKVLSIVKYLNQ